MYLIYLVADNQLSCRGAGFRRQKIADFELALLPSVAAISRAPLNLLMGFLN